MLNLDHPMTTHIFAASGLLDAIKERARCMTVVPSLARFTMYQECQSFIEELRRLNHQHFESKPSIDAALTELDLGIKTIAEMGNGEIIEDHSDGTGVCPVCVMPVHKFDAMCGISPTPSWIIMCYQCINPMIDPLDRLGRSRGGFGTDAI